MKGRGGGSGPNIGKGPRASQKCIAGARTDIVAYSVSNMLVTYMEAKKPQYMEWQADQYIGPLRIIGLNVEANILLTGVNPQLLARVAAGLKQYVIEKCFPEATASRPLHHVSYMGK